MNKLVFPYGIKFQEDGKISVFPAVELFVLGRHKDGIRALFHIDSGATMSILPRGDADILGIDLKNSNEISVRGISGDAMKGYQNVITIHLDQLEIKIPAIFVENDGVPRVLGREGFFNRFGILFDELKRKTRFLDSTKERKTLDSLFDS